LFCIGNVIDVVEMRSQAFRQRKYATEVSLDPNATSKKKAGVGNTNIQANINRPVDPASAWTLLADGSVREKKGGVNANNNNDDDDDDDDEDDTLLATLTGEPHHEPDEEEREFTMLMIADGVAEDVMRVKLDTWRVCFPVFAYLPACLVYRSLCSTP